ncbi:MAG: hypothetical protein EP298_11665 [Gammaproteobacteria bacterium]|nr:MAG: hypothetical protein EP298_11665 [Gammaproteobacteria bacterium]UTW42085.1 hypothetical protein KFE69_11355 [bacterium SCSIO 12844]
MDKLLVFLIFIILPFAVMADGVVLPKGNGVIIDDVAQDMLCNSQKSECHSSLIDDVNQYYKSKNKTLYIFPDFANIVQLHKSGLSNINDNCDLNTNQYVLNYNSLPLIKSSVLSMPQLGKCISGLTITKLYRNLDNYSQNRIIMPMINGSAQLLNSANTTQLVQLADIIAKAINDDPNASGVSFDLENPSMSEAVITKFIGPLAAKLKQSNKAVAIFDANLEALASISEQYQNVIALVALYDYGLNPALPYNPIRVNRYQQYTQDHAVAAYFGGYGKDIPVLFVSPAAATTTLWENLDVYNSNFTQGVNPGLELTPTECDTNNVPDSILNQFLTLADGSHSPSAVTNFINACKAYENPHDIKQIDYFNASLKAIILGYQASENNQKKLLGTVLYNQKPNGFYAIICAKNSYSIYETPSLYKKCLGFYPETISNAIWQSLSQWDIPSGPIDKSSWVFTP